MHRTEWRRSLIDTAVESRSWLTGLVLHRVWRTCGRWMGERKTRAIALAGDSTMKSWEICTMSRAMNYPQATGIRPVFGLAGNAVLLRQAATTLQEARRLHRHRVALAQAHGQAPPTSSRLYDEFVYAAGSWARSWRVVLKAEVMQADDNPRFVVTSLMAPPPQMLYEDL